MLQQAIEKEKQRVEMEKRRGRGDIGRYLDVVGRDADDEVIVDGDSDSEDGGSDSEDGGSDRIVSEVSSTRPGVHNNNASSVSAESVRRSQDLAKAMEMLSMAKSMEGDAADADQYVMTKSVEEEKAEMAMIDKIGREALRVSQEKAHKAEWDQQEEEELQMQKGKKAIQAAERKKQQERDWNLQQIQELQRSQQKKLLGDDGTGKSGDWGARLQLEKTMQQRVVNHAEQKKKQQLESESEQKKSGAGLDVLPDWERERIAKLERLLADDGDY